MFQIMYSSGKVKGHLYWPRKVISLKSTKPLLKMDLWIILLRLFASNMGVNISPLLTYIPVLLKILVFKTTPLGSNWYLPMLYINTFANKRTIKLQISSICAWKSWNVSLMDSPTPDVRLPWTHHSGHFISWWATFFHWGTDVCSAQTRPCGC